MTFRTFIRLNWQWLAGGIALTFFSSVGQTFFIALFAGNIRQEFQISHGQFGAVYMLATLCSALTLTIIGKVVDQRSVAAVVSVVLVALALACAVMALAETISILVLAIFALRLFGQGMISHTIMTAMGRWYVAERGRAVSIASIGHHLGEAILPTVVVALMLWLDWRLVWWFSAAALLTVALPMSLICFAENRTPQTAHLRSIEVGRQWTRSEVLADGPFWAVCLGLVVPSFIGTSVFFHQVHLAEIKGWSTNLIAGSFAIMSLTNVVISLISGHQIDRFSSRQLLPLFLLPLALACMVLALIANSVAMLVFMFLLGVSFGMYSALFGTIWPELYGTRHLGAIRSVVFAAVVFSSALGPGITGWLIDIGVGFESQLLVMGGFTLLAALFLVPVSHVLSLRVS